MIIPDASNLVPDTTTSVDAMTPNEALGYIAEQLRARLALLSETFRAIAETLAPSIETITRAIATVYEQLRVAVWDVYEQAGMPYGPTDDGMWRWLREKREIEQLRARIAYLEEYHYALADVRIRAARNAETYARLRTPVVTDPYCHE